MLEELLPPNAVAVEARDDIAGVELFPEEELLVSRAVEKRRREFATARACAREALARLGIDPVAIAAGPRGAPQWPAGVVGSITHCEGYRACAAGREAEFVTIGVDAEPNAPLPQGVFGDIALPEERWAVAELARQDASVHWDRLLFILKEAVYKAWFPLAGSWLGFEDALATIDAGGGTFEARLLVPGPLVGGRELASFPGRWLSRDGFVLAAIAIAAIEPGGRVGTW
jgi:4'-phosphopantetheinyl transferase EntD